MASNESPYMISYLSVIQLKSVSLLVFEILAENQMFDLERSKVISINESLL